MSESEIEQLRQMNYEKAEALERVWTLTVRPLEHLVEQLRTELAKRERLVNLAESKSCGVWTWQGDGEDHLESIACPILISAGDLAAIIAAKERAEGMARRELTRADLLEGQVKSRDSDIALYEKEVRMLKASRRAVLELESRTRAESNRLRRQLKTAVTALTWYRDFAGDACGVASTAIKAIEKDTK